MDGVGRRRNIIRYSCVYCLSICRQHIHTITHGLHDALHTPLHGTKLLSFLSVCARHAASFSFLKVNLNMQRQI